MFYLTCTIISNVDLVHYGVSRAKDCVSVDCDTRKVKAPCIPTLNIHDHRTENFFKFIKSQAIYRWCSGPFNPTGLRKAKIVYNFGLFECNSIIEFSENIYGA